MRARSLLILASTYPARPGDGTPGFVRDLAVQEAEQFRTTVLVPAVPGGPAVEQDGPLSVQRFRYFFGRWEDLSDGAILENLRSQPSRWLQVPLFFAAEVVALRRQIRKERPDVMHIHWLIPQGLVARIGAPGIPKLVTTLGGDLYGLTDPISRRLIRSVLRNARMATAMNSQMRDRLIELGADPDTTHVLPMGADLDAIRPLADAVERVPGRLLFVGRLVEKKGLAVLLRALRELDDVDFELRVVGDGPLRAELERQAEGLSVTFLGALPRTELAREYGGASVAVVPSVSAASGDQDGLPVAMLEAMGAGCAVVASRLPGLQDAVQDGVSGFLATPGSSTELTQALRRLLTDPALAERTGLAARDRAEEFSVTAIGRRYISLLDSMIESGELPSGDERRVAAHG